MRTTITTILLVASTVLTPAQNLDFFKNEKGKKGVKNNKGEIIIKPEYDFVYSFAQGIIAVNKGGSIYDEEANADGGKWGFFNFSGNEITPLKYDNARPLSNSIQNPFVAVNIGCNGSGLGYCSDGLWGIIDKTGEEIVSLKYNYIETALVSNETQVALVELNKKFGYIDATNGKEITPIKYDEARLFRWNSVAKVRLNDKWGIIDKTGKELTPQIYDEISNFENDTVKVKLGNREFYIDKYGNEVK